MWKIINLRTLTILLSVSFFSNLYAANYPLEITQPQEGLTTHSRYYKAYPGIEYKVPIGVFGGLYPFAYEFDHHLYVTYVATKEHVEVTKIPIIALETILNRE